MARKINASEKFILQSIFIRVLFQRIHCRIRRLSLTLITLFSCAARQRQRATILDLCLFMLLLLSLLKFLCRRTNRTFACHTNECRMPSHTKWNANVLEMAPCFDTINTATQFIQHFFLQRQRQIVRRTENGEKGNKLLVRKFFSLFSFLLFF